MEEEIEEKPFHVDRAKTGRAACKKCKQKIEVGVLRLAKLSANPFGSGMIKNWHHVTCMFEAFAKMRKTTRKIESFDDIGGWESLAKADQDTIKGHFSAEELKKLEAAVTMPIVEVKATELSVNKDNLFRTFRKICNDLTQESSVKGKVDILKEFFEKGVDGNGFKGDLVLWFKSLLPMCAKRIYNLQSDQLIKIFSSILGQDESEMRKDLEQGDVAETISKFMEGSKITATKKSQLTLQAVETFLEKLSKLTREVDQTSHFHTILPHCTANDLKMIIRLIKHDLRTNAGANRVLMALDENAVAAFQASRDLEAVVKNALGNKGKGKKLTVGVKVMTPVLPMLAEACTSVEKAFKRCPGGMFSEIKYDGERVQLHKQGKDFKYFSRSLKPVVAHKVKDVEEYIPQAFPHGKDLILDSEILLVDTRTGALLPFGTLGTHKRTQFQNASVCLFIFDCIFFNGTSLVDKPLTERRQVLKANMIEIPHRVQFSEMKAISKPSELEDMIERVLRQGLEGLVLKPVNSVYEPGKRRWLKVKKDYLAGGSMADCADLVVLGGWYGTGKKGGIMSVFLMGCFCKKRGKWVTVTKVYGGLDDKTLEALQKQLKMKKAGKDVNNVPGWLHCDKTMVPDFIIRDPKESQVWEICGAEFSCNQAVHTADGISIRFPRVKRIRDDKTWETATTLEELKKLYKASKDTSGFTLQRQSEESPKKVDLPKKDNEKTPQKPKAHHKRPNDSSASEDSAKKPKLESSQKRPNDSSASEDSAKKPKSESSHKRPNDSSTSEDSAKKSKLESSQKQTNDSSTSEDSAKKPKLESSQKRPNDSSASEDSAKKPKSESSHKRPKDSSTSEDSAKKSKLESSQKQTNDSSTSEDSAKKPKLESSQKRTNDSSASEDSAKKSKLKTPPKPQNDSSASEDSTEKRPSQTSASNADNSVKTENGDNSNASLAILMKNPLPDIFKDRVIFLTDSVPDSSLLERFIIAYGGKMFCENFNTGLRNARRDVTHVVYSSQKVKKKVDFRKARSAGHVSVDWLWGSIKAGKYLRSGDFKVHVS